MDGENFPARAAADTNRMLNKTMQTDHSIGEHPGEVDLVEVTASLWRQRWLILGITGIVTCGAALYAYLTPPVYEARMVLLAPTQSAIANFNYGRTRGNELAPFTAQSVFDIFVRNLEAGELRRSFFERVYLPSVGDAARGGSQDALYGRFNAALLVREVTSVSAKGVALAVQNSDPQRAAQWATQYVQEAADAAKLEMITNVTREAEVRARDITQQIENLREISERSRQDKIAQLQEAIRVADAIGLKKPPIITGGSSSEVTATMNGALTYMRGTVALRAEIANLERRDGQDAFIAELRPLQADLQYYQHMNVTPESVSVYQLDGPVEVPDYPVKPRKSLVMIAGVLGGLVLGGLVALIRFAYLRRRID